MKVFNTTIASIAFGTVSLLAMGDAALAGSVTEPGETIGMALGAPLPEGVYFVDTASYNSLGGPYNAVFNIPVITWSTPWKVLGGRLWGYAALPEGVLDKDSSSTGGGESYAGLYNPAALVGLAWDLGGGFGFSDVVGGYAPMKDDLTNVTGGNFWTFNNRAALSYTGDGYDITGHLIYGTSSTDNKTHLQTQPDYINFDLTATKTFGKWEVGPVAYGAWDVSNATRNLRAGTTSHDLQSEVALGVLAGYNFGPVITQVFFTHDVEQENQGGEIGRFFFRLTVPLGTP